MLLFDTLGESGATKPADLAAALAARLGRVRGADWTRAGTIAAMRSVADGAVVPYPADGSGGGD